MLVEMLVQAFAGLFHRDVDGPRYREVPLPGPREDRPRLLFPTHPISDGSADDDDIPVIRSASSGRNEISGQQRTSPPSLWPQAAVVAHASWAARRRNLRGMQCNR